MAELHTDRKAPSSGNPNAPTLMLAEKASDVIRGRAPLPPLDLPVWIAPGWATAQRQLSGVPPEKPALLT